jgi:DNA-binding transcriptional MerR regulator
MVGSEAHDEIGPEWLTIDALAQSTAVTVRNIRAYQARGLLPAPVVRARTGYYGPEHRARLELIKDLQGQGLKLDTIRRLFETTGGSTEQVLEFIRAVRQLFAAEPGQIVSAAELAERFAPADPAVLRRAVKAGLLREVGDDQYEDVNPRLTEAGRACVELGIPLDRVLSVAAQVRRHADAVAKVYVQLFLDEVWKPFDSSGRPDDQWPHVHESLQQLRKVSGDALLALLDVSVSERLEVTFGRDITRNVRAAARQSDGRPDEAGNDA